MPTLFMLLRAQGTPSEESWVQEFFDQVLTFLYALAHGAGQLVARLVEFILGRPMPEDLIDPLGFLILLTVFLIIVEVSKRLAWLLVIVGWVLIVVRIVMEALGK